MAYELFTVKAARLGSPALTITADGRFTLNADAGDLLRRAGAKSVQILWDATACKLALRPLARPGDSSYKLQVRKGKRGTMLSARTFLRYIGWDLSKPATVPVEWNEKEKILEAPLPPLNFIAKNNGDGAGRPPGESRQEGWR